LVRDPPCAQIITEAGVDIGAAPLTETKAARDLVMAVHHKESDQKISWVKFVKVDIEKGHYSTFEEVGAKEIEAT
jgi:hypothetical protein